MPAVCLYFQLHQPKRLRRYSVFDAGTAYFDDDRNQQILRRVASKCYMPATESLLRQIEATDGQMRVTFSITGTLIDQLREWAPEVLVNFRRLTETGCVEWLGETYYHSLTFLYHHDEFLSQVEAHRDAIEDLFGQRPHVFRNTELIYSNDLARFLSEDGGYTGVLAEGVESLLGGRSANKVFQTPQAPGISVLLKNYQLSDDIAFRFNNTDNQGTKLTAESFAKEIAALDGGKADVCNLFMDFETFGEHQWAETGIFEFLEQMPKAVLDADNSFATCSEAIDQHAPQENSDPDRVFDCPAVTSWADQERDASAWVGNAMQSSAHGELYKLGAEILKSNNQALIDDWRCLTVSDHFYYMCTKSFGDGDVHAYFNPYESPYDAYINFMNVVDHLRTRVEAINA